MPAPLAKGLIIAASVIVAAGIALYESPQVRQWVDQSRRKIAVALHSLGDEISPQNSRSRSAADDLDQANRRKREDAVRRRRSELIRKAREEGVTVDLDELARIGTELQELQHPIQRKPSAADRSRSFDDIVGEDGKLKEQGEKSQSTVKVTGAEDSEKAELRFRGRGVDGFQKGSAYANPFADDESQVVFDRQLIGVEANEASSNILPAQLNHTSRETSITLPPEDLYASAHSQPLIDTSESSLIETAQTASIHSLQSQTSPFEDALARSATMPQSPPSFHTSPSSTPARSRANTLSLFTPGDATPTDDGFSSTASVVGSHADDIAALSESLLSTQRDDDEDNASVAFSETGFSEIGAGQSTPGSWTDVGSDSEGEMGMH